VLTAECIDVKLNVIKIITGDKLLNISGHLWNNTRALHLGTDGT